MAKPTTHPDVVHRTVTIANGASLSVAAVINYAGAISEFGIAARG